MCNFAEYAEMNAEAWNEANKRIKDGRIDLDKKQRGEDQDLISKLLCGFVWQEKKEIFDKAREDAKRDFRGPGQYIAGSALEGRGASYVLNRWKIDGSYQQMDRPQNWRYADCAEDLFDFAIENIETYIACMLYKMTPNTIARLFTTKKKEYDCGIRTRATLKFAERYR